MYGLARRDVDFMVTKMLEGKKNDSCTILNSNENLR